MGLCMCKSNDANTPPSSAKVDETDELKQTVESPTNDSGSAVSPPTEENDEIVDEIYAHESPSDGYVQKEWIFDPSGHTVETNTNTVETQKQLSTEIVYAEDDGDTKTPETDSDQSDDHKEPIVVYDSDRGARSGSSSSSDDDDSVKSVSSVSSALSHISVQSVPVQSVQSEPLRTSRRKRKPKSMSRSRSRPQSSKDSKSKSKKKRKRHPRAKSLPPKARRKKKKIVEKRNSCSTHLELGNMVRYSLDIEHDEQWLYAELAHINGKDIMGSAKKIRKKRFMEYMKNAIDLEDTVAKKLWKDIDRDRAGTVTVKQFEKWKKRHAKPTALAHLFK